MDGTALGYTGGGAGATVDMVWIQSRDPEILYRIEVTPENGVLHFH